MEPLVTVKAADLARMLEQARSSVFRENNPELDRIYLDMREAVAQAKNDATRQILELKTRNGKQVS